MNQPKISEDQLVFFTDYTCYRYVGCDQEGDPNWENVDSYCEKNPIVKGLNTNRITTDRKFIIGNIMNKLRELEEDLREVDGEFADEVALTLEKLEFLK